MQNESAMTPYSSLPSGVLNAGGSGGRCHTLQLNPGTVLYPNSNSKFAGSVAAHMPSLFRARGRTGRTGEDGERASADRPGPKRERREGRRDWAGGSGRETRVIAWKFLRATRVEVSREEPRLSPRERAAERDFSDDAVGALASTRARATYLTPLYAASSSMEVPPFLGMWMNTGPLYWFAYGAISSTLTGRPSDASAGPLNTPARACVATTPSATAPEAIIATRDQRDAFAAPSSLTRRRGASPSRARRGTRSPCISRAMLC